MMSSALAIERPPLDPRRIGQEIHDLIGHKLSLMVLHAGALEMSGQDEHAAAIREAGTSAIAGLRRIVTLLCEDDEIEQPAFDANSALTTLVGASRQAGLPVRLTADPLGQVEPEVSQVVVSLVREALTNIHKHAGAVPTEVRVIVAACQVFVEVVNQPSRGAAGADRPGTQRGLRGMRELVGWCGGYLGHARTPEGGFRVRAVLPL
jgi:signal transduction histidine kinase